MPFEPGREKTGGRTKGTKNKASETLQAAFNKAFTPQQTKELLRAAIEQAKDGKPTLLLGLMNYGVSEMPKTTQHTGAEEGPIEFVVNLSPPKNL